MKRRPRESEQPAIKVIEGKEPKTGKLGLIFSGGGVRASYQVGALRALTSYIESSESKVNYVLGSSLGAINGLILSACLKDGYTHAVDQLDALWRCRNFRNTFGGSPTGAFYRAIKIAFMQYLSPGPKGGSEAIFDPSPLIFELDTVLAKHGGLSPDQRAHSLEAIAVMTTVEGEERKPLLFISAHKKFDPSIFQGAAFDICYVDELTSKHGFASAALPSVLPPVEIDTDRGRVRLVDGGISNNVPVDPAVRMGAERVILFDISGRDWWLKRFGKKEDQRPEWEVPAGMETFCLRPPETFIIRCQEPLGPLLKSCVGQSRSKFIQALGPVWPLFALLKNKLGEDVAYETMSYVALDPDFIAAVIERGFNETTHLLRNQVIPPFESPETVEKFVSSILGRK